MITVRLIGGLGNQMFQYAAARRLALARRVPVRLDLSAFRDYRLHQGFRLNHFSLPSDIRLRGQDRPRLRLPILEQIIVRGIARQRVVKEGHFHFDASILELDGHVYLDGYWQSPKYFADCEHVIRAEFKVRDALAGENLEMAKRIGDCTSVSLHVRRGDYVSNSTTNLYHGTCSPEYYEAAEEEVRSRYGRIRLFVFSDDPDWAEANLRFPSSVQIVRHNGPERDYEDLRLMSMCQHHIIANSTFSWWGAWLSDNSYKTVVTPRNWFRQASNSTADLIPEQWIRL